MKKRTLNIGNNIKQPDIKYSNIDYPVFCFRHLHKRYHLDKCNDSEKKCLIDQIAMLSLNAWTDIQLSGKHGIGAEKISINALRGAKLPANFTEDITHLLAFRFDGKKPFIGFRNGFIFHIFFIDRAFTLYNHG